MVEILLELLMLFIKSCAKFVAKHLFSENKKPPLRQANVSKRVVNQKIDELPITLVIK